MFGRFVLAFAFLSLMPIAHGDEPQWLVDARAREGKASKMRSFRSSDGFVTAEVPAKVLNKIAEDEGAYLISLDIGSETPANCEVIRDGFDLGALLRATAELTFTQVEPIQGKVEQRIIERTDAGAFVASPFLAIDWLYRVNDGKQARAGGLKQIAVLKDGHGLYCAHVDLGYAKTFRNVVKALAETMKFAEEGPDSYFAEISTVSLGNMKVGIVTTTFERDQDGDTRMLVSTALAIRVTQETLRTQDSTHVQWSRPDGSLINEAHSASTDGELDTDLKLSEADDGAWVVEGEFMGKAISESIVANRAPSTAIEQAHAKRKLFGLEDVVGQQVVLPCWNAIDPTRFMDAQTTIVGVIDDQNMSAREALGGITMDVILDKATGTSSKGTMHIGPQSLEFDRIYVQGSF